MAKQGDALKEKCRITTPEFRVSYPHVFKATRMKNKKGQETGDPKYSITMLFSKKTDITDVKRAIRYAKIVAFGEDKSEWPEDLQSPIIDGDKPKYAKKEGYKGHWVVKAVSNEASKPSVVDKNVEPITELGDFYPGCYARAQIFARAWEFSGKQGIHFILDHVQKTKDGKSFGGKKAVKEVFSPLDSDEDDEDDDSDEESDDDSDSEDSEESDDESDDSDDEDGEDGFK